MKASAKPSVQYSALLTAAIALCVSGCVTHKHAARPVSATLEIQVQGQWRTLQRVVYQYEAPMDEPYQTLPTAELERLLRERESSGVFGPETTALRILIETRKAGIK